MERLKTMKNSGIEWVGEIPAHWEVMSNKHLMQKQKIICPIYKGQAILSLTMKGVIERDLDAGGKMPSSFDGYQYVKRGNLLLCLFDIDVTPRCAGLILKDGVTSPAYSQYIMRQKAYAPFYSYYYVMVDNTKELLHMAKNLRHSLNEEQFGAIKAPVPPISEQKAIAEFLDIKCGEVDALIADIQQEIETLEQYKRSVITETVTKGLDPSVPLKDSGIDWVQTIPNHWIVHPLYYYFEERKNKNIFAKEQNLLSLSYGKIIRKDINANGGLLPENFNAYNIVEPKDIVLRLTDLQNDRRSLRTGFVNERGIITSAYVTLKVKKNIIQEFFYYELHVFDLMKGLYNMGSGVRQGLNFDELSKLKLFEPTIKEQMEIVAYIKEKEKKIEEIIADKQSQIETLESYKKSLIYEYVTGKKEVSHVSL